MSPPSPPSPASGDELAQAAIAARAHAHAPYSGYRVGAAVAGADGRVYAGANVENASYGLAICAERSAIGSLVSDGGQRVVAIAVATASSPPAAPCGACRQVIAEFASDDVEVLCVNERGERRAFRVGELLPHAFRARDLG